MSKFCEKFKECSTEQEEVDGEGHMIPSDKIKIGCGFIQPKYKVGKLCIKMDPR